MVHSAVLLVASCAPMSAPMSAPTTTTIPDPNVEVKVAGTPAQLAAFDKALQSIIGTEPLGCLVMVNGQVSACDVLQKSPVPSTATDLTYVFLGSHTFVNEKFGAAFNQVPKQFGPNLPTLTIRPIPPVAQDCSMFPQPCVNAPYCIQYRRCSKQQSPCAPC